MRDTARRRGVLSTHTNYVRFLILGMGRSGTNLLASSLRSHGEIVAFGEIFNTANHDRILWEYPGYNYTPRQIALRAKQPTAFIDSVVFQPMPAGTRAVGFKLFYYQARDEAWRDIWPHLQAMDIRVIHLKRRNLLAHQLSMVKALKTKEWSTRREGGGTGAPAVELDYDSCLKGFETVVQWQEDADCLFLDHPRLELWYEDLDEHYADTLARAQAFLGVEPHPTATPLKKQSTLPLSEAISNYAELRQRFMGSRWEAFFD